MLSNKNAFKLMYSGANVVSQNLWAVCALLNGTIDAITLLGGDVLLESLWVPKGPQSGSK